LKPEWWGSPFAPEETSQGKEKKQYILITIIGEEKNKLFPYVISTLSERPS
jgi:hypothetical protein